MDETNLENPILIGTAFPVGRGVFVTAGHVVEALDSSINPTLRKFYADGTAQAVPIKKSESWDGIDFGFLHAENIQDTEIISWIDARFVELADVLAMGFAHGFDPQRKKLTMRHFKGHIVARQKYNSWTEMAPGKQNVPEVPFETYELSFAGHKCLSGAPLLEEVHDGMVVIGIILGNSEIQLPISTYTEEISSTEKKTFTNHHSFFLGQALTTQSVLDQPSILLGNIGETKVKKNKTKTLREHLGDKARKVIIENTSPNYL